MDRHTVVTTLRGLEAMSPIQRDALSTAVAAVRSATIASGVLGDSPQLGEAALQTLEHTSHLLVGRAKSLERLVKELRREEHLREVGMR